MGKISGSTNSDNQIVERISLLPVDESQIQPYPIKTPAEASGNFKLITYIATID